MDLRRKLLDGDQYAMCHCLELLDFIMKNCSSEVHEEILSAEFLAVVKTVVTVGCSEGGRIMCCSVDGWMYSTVEGWGDGLIDGWVDGVIDGWVDGVMEWYMDGWVGGWVDVVVVCFCFDVLAVRISSLLLATAGLSE